MVARGHEPSAVGADSQEGRERHAVELLQFAARVDVPEHKLPRFGVGRRARVPKDHRAMTVGVQCGADNALSAGAGIVRTTAPVAASRTVPNASMIRRPSWLKEAS